MSDKFQNKYRISSARLQNWDYGWNAAYFVTICTHNREYILGEIDNGKMILSEIGKIAQQYWNEIPAHFPFVELDSFVVMPNHVHGIIIINKTDNVIVETQNFASRQSDHPKNKFGPQSQNLASIIRGYKSGVKKYATINKIDFTWQPRFYDHIIRNDKSYHNIANYIINNPLNWKGDEFSGG
ncbi:MAG: hypothetical protein PF484_07100 [Bacteroidales bacterium]|jgi:putative transposase|nr:hypothetical protein [Bacteroidales bacterium]